jgi:hypothetical protein
MPVLGAKDVAAVYRAVRRRRHLHRVTTPITKTSKQGVIELERQNGSEVSADRMSLQVGIWLPAQRR